MARKFSVQPLINLCICALVIRVVLVFAAWSFTQDASVFESPDSASYLRVTGELLRTGSFSQNGIPEIFRTPGYPLLLAVGMAAGYAKGFVIVLQILLSVLSCTIVFFIGKEIFKEEKAAWLAACFYAFEPLSILFSAKILTETFFTFVLVLGFYAFISFMKDQQNLHLIVSAVCFAFLPYIRPVAYYLPVILLFFLGIYCFQRRVFYAFFIFSFILCVGIGYWHQRNDQKAGYPGFSSVSEFNAYFFQGAAVKAAKEGKSFPETQKEMGYMNPAVYEALHPEQKGWPAGKIYQFMSKEGSGLILQNPWIYCKIHFKGMAKILLDPGADEWLKIFKLYPERGGLLAYFNDHGLIQTLRRMFQDTPLLFGLNMLMALILFAYFLSALIGLSQNRDVFQIDLLICVCLYFLIISAGPQSMARFRHPMMPFIALLAGRGLQMVTLKICHKRFIKK